MNEQKYPELTVGAVIYNDKNEILLIKSPKWENFWVIPGGHVETEEECETAMKREVKEETGLDICDLEFIGWKEVINPEHFFKKKHFIALNYSAKACGGELKKSDEMVDYSWVKPEVALKEMQIDNYALKSIKFYLDNLDKKENENYIDKYKRALADYHNLLKQTAREKEEFVKFANESLLYEILPIYDHLKLALAHSQEENTSSWLEGVRHVANQFKNTLSDLGVKEIETLGQKFDHHTMEALANEETEDKGKDGFVAKEIKAGYRLNGKVIIPAKVVVYKIVNNE